MSVQTAMKQVQIPLVEWEALAELSTRERVPPGELLQEALRWYVAQKNRIAQSRQALPDSFGVWQERKDLPEDSVDLVNELRENWHERARRLGID
jgi:hypothetical protein